MDSKSQKLMLIGYSDNHKVYQSIDLDTDHLASSRDVVFDEEGGPFLLSSCIQRPGDQPLRTKDLIVRQRLPLAPRDGRDSDDSKPELVESPRNNIVPPNFL